MKRIWISALSVAACLSGGPVVEAAYSQTPGAIAFVDVAVVPMDRERVLTHQTVLVQGNRIVAVGPTKEIRVPAGAQRIDGRGQYLIPGLADMHSHTGAHDTLGLLLDVANGVTTIRDMSSGRDLEELRERRAAGALLPPRLYGIGRVYECDQQMHGPLVSCFTRMKTAGYDMLKLYGDGTDDPAVLDSILAAARAAHLPVGGHVLPGPGLKRALQAPYRSIEHLWGYMEYLLPDSPVGFYDQRPLLDTAVWLGSGYRLDTTKLHDVAAATQRAGTWNAPTLVVFEGMLYSMQTTVDSLQSAGADTGAAAELPLQLRAARQRFALHLQLVKALHDAGAGLLLSSDVLGEPVSGFAVHRELELFVQAGLTPYQALATGTRNVAAYLGTSDSAGTVAVGKWADLVLLEGNPLRDIRYASGPAGVLVGGQWFSRAAFEARLDTLMAAHHDQGCGLHELQQQAVAHRGISQAALRAVRTCDRR